MRRVVGRCLYTFRTMAYRMLHRSRRLFFFILPCSYTTFGMTIPRSAGAIIRQAVSRFPDACLFVCLYRSFFSLLRGSTTHDTLVSAVLDDAMSCIRHSLARQPSPPDIRYMTRCGGKRLQWFWLRFRVVSGFQPGLNEKGLSQI